MRERRPIYVGREIRQHFRRSKPLGPSETSEGHEPNYPGPAEASLGAVRRAPVMAGTMPTNADPSRSSDAQYDHAKECRTVFSDYDTARFRNSEPEGEQ